MTGPLVAAVQRLIWVDCGRIGETYVSDGTGLDSFWRAGLAVNHPRLAQAFFRGEDSHVAAVAAAGRMRAAALRGHWPVFAVSDRALSTECGA